MTIGVLKANSRNDDLAALAREKGFTCQTVEHAEEAELTEALHNGEGNGIVASSLRKHTGEKIVARFAPGEFCVIVRKSDTDLPDEINNGIEQVDPNEGDWRNKLYYKYTTNNSGSILSFTREEQDYMRAVQSGEKVITACAQPDRGPEAHKDLLWSNATAGPLFMTSEKTSPGPSGQLLHVSMEGLAFISLIIPNCGQSITLCPHSLSKKSFRQAAASFSELEKFRKTYD